jgi:heme-degrading monooxygenase HmoA
VIARIWTGAVLAADAGAYVEYMLETGLPRYIQTPGNRGAWILRRDLDDRTEFTMFTLWDFVDAIKAFAGDDHERAVFYPEDDRFLVERDLRVRHYEVVSQTTPPSRLKGK